VIDLWIRYRQLFSSIVQSIMQKSLEYSHDYCRKQTNETINRSLACMPIYLNWINKRDEKTLEK